MDHPRRRHPPRALGPRPRGLPLLCPRRLVHLCARRHVRPPCQHHWVGGPRHLSPGGDRRAGALTTLLLHLRRRGEARGWVGVCGGVRVGGGWSNPGGGCSRPSSSVLWPSLSAPTTHHPLPTCTTPCLPAAAAAGVWVERGGKLCGAAGDGAGRVGHAAGHRRPGAGRGGWFAGDVSSVAVGVHVRAGVGGGGWLAEEDGSLVMCAGARVWVDVKVVLRAVRACVRCVDCLPQRAPPPLPPPPHTPTPTHAHDWPLGRSEMVPSLPPPPHTHTPSHPTHAHTTGQV